MPKHYKTRTYRSWAAMKTKCNNPHNLMYKYGGALGIKVCPQWHSYPAFLNDMGEAPEGKHLDRIDRKEDFSKENCVWATKSEINANHENFTLVTFEGKSLPINQWSLKLFGNKTTLRSRLASGWCVEEAMTKPFGAKRDRPRKETLCRTVYQYTDDGVLVAEYNGLKGAADKMGVTSSSILSAIKLRHKSKGFRWSYDKR